MILNAAIPDWYNHRLHYMDIADYYFKEMYDFLKFLFALLLQFNLCDAIKSCHMLLVTKSIDFRKLYNKTSS